MRFPLSYVFLPVIEKGKILFAANLQYEFRDDEQWLDATFLEWGVRDNPNIDADPSINFFSSLFKTSGLISDSASFKSLDIGLHILSILLYLSKNLSSLDDKD